MWLKWLPWKYIVRHLAKRHGFIDPVDLMSRARRFAEPSEVAEPIELIRAGILFQARGFINSRAIQQNLDWVWPWWVNAQFDPLHEGFIPRAFQMTHINLTGRNWTAVGVPDHMFSPVVDPRGLLMPYWDGWSVDVWLMTEDGTFVTPSSMPHVKQELAMAPGLSVRTRTAEDAYSLESVISVERFTDTTLCRLRVNAEAAKGGVLVFALRPYNPEGVSFVHEIAMNKAQTTWRVDDYPKLLFSEAANRHRVSNYNHGDVSHHLAKDASDQLHTKCNVGMATAASIFKLAPNTGRQVDLLIPPKDTTLSQIPEVSGCATKRIWDESLAAQTVIEVPNKKFTFLYNAALHTLLLNTVDDVFAGPYTYQRFWFRDAVFILHALLCAGFKDRCRRLIDTFFPRQTALGYFHSQEGEWDSNGQVLWLLTRYCRLTNTTPPPEWLRAMISAGKWVKRKCTSDKSDKITKGLLPAGFSAEHFGPNDYYFWDDFWAVGGLTAASELLQENGHEKESVLLAEESKRLLNAIDRSLETVATRLGIAAIPAAPRRRMDSGAIGSVVASYPLQLLPETDERLQNTIIYLMDHCRVNGGFFQNMIHSGINPYLTLHLAQSLLRAGDPRYRELMQTIAGMASPTGQWPEAMHPGTGTGCMGDGQHVWAASEWIMMLRTTLIFEDEFNDKLILGKGVFPEWLTPGKTIKGGPLVTKWGSLTLTIHSESTHVSVTVTNTHWHDRAPVIKVNLPGHATQTLPENTMSLTLTPNNEES